MELIGFFDEIDGNNEVGRNRPRKQSGIDIERCKKNVVFLKLKPTFFTSSNHSHQPQTIHNNDNIFFIDLIIIIGRKRRSSAVN
jgi:hypothetical protein